jgi:putative flippase GtrA
MTKLKELIEKYWDVISYLFFGALTTVVDFAVSSVCYYSLGISPDVSNIIAWVAAVIFAYLTNKPWVFKSYDWSLKNVIREFTKFAGSRVFSGVLVTVCIKITVGILGWNFMAMKIITSILNIVLNYIASKLLVFRKKS